MPARPRATFKVVLLGEAGVGKTCLIRRYIRGSFSEGYVATIGTTVSKRVEQVPLDHGGRAEVSLVIWDIMGNRSIMDLLGEAYFHGAGGGLFVFDLTRPQTLEALGAWVGSAWQQAPSIPFLALGDKADLQEFRKIDEGEAEAYCREMGLPYLPTSARTGANVEEALRRLSVEMLREATVARPNMPSTGDA